MSNYDPEILEEDQDRHQAFIIHDNQGPELTLIPFSQVAMVYFNKTTLKILPIGVPAAATWGFKCLKNQAEVREQISDYFSQYIYGARIISESQTEAP